MADLVKVKVFNCRGVRVCHNRSLDEAVDCQLFYQRAAVFLSS